MSNATQHPGSTPLNDEPRSALLPWHLQAAALIAVLGAIGLFILVLLRPSGMETPTSQFFVCAGLGVCLAVLFFVFWPDKFFMDKVPYINVPVRVTGPITLWIVVFLLLWTLVPPAGKYGALFKPSGYKEPIRFNADAKLKREDEKPLEYRLIPDRDSLLEAVYVEFEPGETTIKAIFIHPTGRQEPVEFTRGIPRVDVSHLRKE